MTVPSHSSHSGLITSLMTRSSRGVHKLHVVKMTVFSMHRAMHLTHGLWLLGSSPEQWFSGGATSPLGTPGPIWRHLRSSRRGGGGRAVRPGQLPAPPCTDAPMVTNDGAQSPVQPRPRNPEQPRGTPPAAESQGPLVCLAWTSSWRWWPFGLFSSPRAPTSRGRGLRRPPDARGVSVSIVFPPLSSGSWIADSARSFSLFLTGYSHSTTQPPWRERGDPQVLDSLVHILCSPPPPGLGPQRIPREGRPCPTHECRSEATGGFAGSESGGGAAPRGEPRNPAATSPSAPPLAGPPEPRGNLASSSSLVPGDEVAPTSHVNHIP